MNRFSLLPALAATLLLASCGGTGEGGKMPWDDDLLNKPEAEAGYEVGEVLPAWQKGYLDIHAINSGRGECVFYILPDGTTMVVDAGEVMAAGDGYIQRKPDQGTRPYVTYARYIKHFLPEGKKKVDYMYLTHFHIDHMGESNGSYPMGANGYRPTGVSALYDEMPFTTLLDRGYPSYGNDPTILKPESSATDNYIAFVNYATSKRGLKAERIEVGSGDQVRLLNDNSYDCKVTNIIGNGFYLSPQRTVEHQAITGENPASCGFHLRYGKFDYIACGDLTGAPQNRMADYVTSCIGSLEGFKSNHHLSANSWGTSMQEKSFSPRVVLNESFSDYQPDKDVLAGILSGKFEKNTVIWTKDVFLTNAHANALKAYPDLFKDCHYNGHVVIRVSPGGDQYSVYMLDDSNFLYKIKSIHGPFSSK